MNHSPGTPLHLSSAQELAASKARWHWVSNWQYHKHETILSPNPPPTERWNVNTGQQTSRREKAATYTKCVECERPIRQHYRATTGLCIRCSNDAKLRRGDLDNPGDFCKWQGWRC